ncbi:ribosomal RNA processing protein 36 homolog [Oscarella lobularis]|uniref:ribosomal RNA processing protein 36 homolog n=1 Tax=Oscarella lobularis TaxID=121494 RepID=UPI00331369C1
MEEKRSSFDRIKSMSSTDLGDVPLEELQLLKSQIGTRKYREKIEKKMLKKRESETEEGDITPPSEKRGTATVKKSFKRANKNRPREMSSKKPVRKLREIVVVGKKVKRDPRFDDRSGHLNPDLFRKSYAFVEDQKEKEKKLIKRQIKRTKSVGKKEKLSSLLQKVEQREREEKQREEKQKVNRELKKERHEKSRKGGKPFYLKKADLKRVALAEKYQALKEKGTIDKYLAKRRKKNAAKEHRYLPYTRRETQKIRKDQ